ncbi:MAG: glycosyltransferase family 39 protein [bacterium]
MDRERRNRVETALVVGLLASILPLCLYRLDIYPASWFDEGIVLQVPKNLVVHGEYAVMRLPQGLHKFDPAIQAGPTILLPIALLFRATGIGLLQARLVMVFYTVSALVIFYQLVREMYRPHTAFLALLLLIFTFDHEFTSFVFMGRQVLAEVPALAFFWLGTLLWLRAQRSSNWSRLVWSGILWGLAMLTKVQFALMVPALLFLFWLFDRISQERLQIHDVLVPVAVSGGCLLMWYGYQALSLGFSDFFQQTAALGSAGKSHFLSFSPRRTLGAISQLSGSSLVLFGLPGMLYSLGLGFQRREEVRECQQVFLVIFSAVWLSWYAFLSIGWMRYAFVPTALSAMFSARLLGDLWDRPRQSRQALSRWLPLSPSQLAVGGMIILLILSGVTTLARHIVQSSDSGLQEFAEYLNTHVPTDVLIESWEWEVDLLTDHTYHHPPYEVTNAFTEHIWYGTSIPPGLYNPLAFRPAYLIVGRFAKWTGIYSATLSEQDCILVASIGEYDLYKVSP